MAEEKIKRGQALLTMKIKAEKHLHLRDPDLMKIPLEALHKVALQQIGEQEAYIEELEEILWNKVGTKEEYQKHIGDKPLGIFVREVVGMDMHAAKTAFSRYLSEVNLTPQQTYFVNAVIEYIVKYGMVADYSVFLKTPFSDCGSIADLFNPKEWKEIMDAINSFKENALA